MKKWISLVISIVVFSTLFVVVQTKETVIAGSSLVLTYSPQPLTAGCVPELIDLDEPFTIYISDEIGNPVDLTLGGQVDDETVWNLLFKDSHPEVIGQYYWVRTDLHNDDGTLEDNKSMFGFRPISIDFSRADDGIYIFKGFCANDTGSFIVTAYTPDRKSAGSVRVEVVSPDVNYEIVNTDDPDGKIFTVPGNPDFVMTAGDNRIYKITAFARNAQGKAIRGIDRDVNVCNGSTEVARFTPFTTRLANFEYNQAESVPATYDINNTTANFMTTTGNRYYLHIGVDYNCNGVIDDRNREASKMGYFNVRDVNSTGNIIKTNYLTYYITSNIQWDSGNFEENPQFNFSPPSEGWGLGSIYNSKKDEGYLIADLNDDQKLDYHDSLLFDSNGGCTFYIFSEDITDIGGFVACNPYGSHDVAGGPPISSSSPSSIRQRYQNDYVFFLDFDCIPDRIIGSGKPGVKVYNATTGIELGKRLFSKDNYDLVFGKENHLLFEITPGDIRDLSPSMEGIIGLTGNQSENTIYGRLTWENGKAVTTMLFTPTGLGESVIWVDAVFKNKTTDGPYQIKLEKINYFDSVRGQGLECFPEKAFEKKDNDLRITVREVGTKRRVEGAEVTVEGCGTFAEGKTDADGVFRCSVNPTTTGELTISAKKNDMISGSITIPVFPQKIKLFLEVDPPVTPTKNSIVAITGTSITESKITCLGKTYNVNDDGTFSIPNIPLEEGNNSILITAEYEDQIAKKLLQIVLDTTPPNLFIDLPKDKFIDFKSWQFTGRAEPGCTVKANALVAEIVNDIFKVEVPLTLGENTIVFTSSDPLGNHTEKEITIYNWHEIVVKLGIGSETARINDEIVVLDEPPFIKEGRTIVPVRFIAECFGAEVEWLKETETIVITFDEKTIIMQIGNKVAMVNGEVFTLDAPPEIFNGRTFVPVRFIAECFGAEVEWLKETETIVIRRLE